MTEETRPATGTWCADCWLAGHRCQALVFVDKTPLCLPCADSEECPFKDQPASWPAVEKVAETLNAMAEEKKPSGWARRLKPEVMERLRAVITMPTPYLAKKYKLAAVTIQRMKRRCGVPPSTRGPGKPKNLLKEHSHG